MDERYAIDPAGFLDLSSVVAKGLDELRRTVDATRSALRDVGEALSRANGLAGAYDALTGPVGRGCRAAVEHGGAVLGAAQEAVAAFCRADAEMAAEATRRETASGADGWRPW
ncbi:hypothetical protein ACFWZW_04585 [Microbacterium enclense]|uniref:hypothetical protein n=1 Tax=Microbacterium enclense TaxID=993073 RepID=UPI0036DB4046